MNLLGWLRRKRPAEIVVVDATQELLLSPGLAFLKLSPYTAELLLGEFSGGVLKCILVGGRAVGYCSIRPDGTDVQVAVHAAMRRRHVATEALRRTIRDAFDRFGWPTVTATTMERADALGRTLAESFARFGARPIGKGARRVRGQLVPEIIWELRREDWKG